MVIENPLMPPRLDQGTIANVVPFTMRENFSQMGMVEGMRVWISDTLVPFVNSNINGLSSEWVKQANSLIETFESITVELVSDVNAETAKIGTSVQEAVDAKSAAEAARDLAEMFASSAADIQDVAVKTIFSNSLSELRKYVDTVYMLPNDRSKNFATLGMFFPEATGAKGDGISDDTSAVEAASALAANAGGSVVFKQGATYNVSEIKIRDNVKYIGNGATIKGTSAIPEGIFNTPQSSGVDSWSIEGFRIDCAGIARRGIFGRGSKFKIFNNHIFGLNGSNSLGGIRVYRNSTDFEVFNNKIEMANDIPFGTFASLVGIYVTGNTTSIYGGLDTANTPGNATEICSNGTISNNYVSGGTHGVSLMAAEKNLVANNYITNQSHRSIILSPQASFNVIHDNMCYHFGSSAIHVAYGSNNNDIASNYIYSDGSFMPLTGSGGEGGIQLYVHCKNNRVFGNKIFAKTAKYGVYVAVCSSGANIDSNDISGFKRAGVAIESDWEEALPTDATYGRPNYSAPPNPAWASWDNGEGLRHVTIHNNRIRREEVGPLNSGIYIGQSKSAIMESITVDSNIIDSQNNNGHDFYCYVTDPTKFIDATITKNRVAPVEVLQVKFSNKLTLLRDYSDNLWQKRSFNVPTNSVDIDWSVSDFRTLTSAATVESFSGLMMDTNYSGRTIVLRLFPGATIQTGGNKYLKGNSPVTATDSNQLITFKVIAGIAFEVGRNF